MYYIMNYIVFNLTIAIIFIGCIVFFITTTCKKDQGVINGMMGKVTRFHFIPLLFFFVLTVLGEVVNKSYNHIKNFYDLNKAGIAIALIGLISMIIIYKFTVIKTEKWWINFFLKGSFSCFTIIFWYNVCYDIYYLRLADRETLRDREWLKECGVSFSIIFGLCCIIFSFIFKDILIAFLNILFYIGFSIYYFKIPEYARVDKDFNENGDGIVDIIILVFSIILFSYLVVGKIIERENEIKA